jgi:hypothetical protein
MTDGAIRRSNGLREFFAHLEGQQGLRVLDVGLPSQANVNVITGLGHRIYSEDLYRELAGDAKGSVSRDWLDHSLNYPAGLLDGILGWDMLDLLPDPEMVSPTVGRLAEITHTGAVLLFFFHTSEPGASVPAFRTTISSPGSLTLQGRGDYRLKRPFNNRNIENMFSAFRSLKFFLAQDGLREVLVVR